MGILILRTCCTILRSGTEVVHAESLHSCARIETENRSTVIANFLPAHVFEKQEPAFKSFLFVATPAHNYHAKPDETPSAANPSSRTLHNQELRSLKQRTAETPPSPHHLRTTTFAASPSHYRLDSVLPGPLPGRGFIPRTIGFVDMCNLWHKRVIRVRVREHRADGE